MSVFAGQWVGQRTCRVCSYVGPETQFVAAGVLEDDTVVITHRSDGATLGLILVCDVCAHDGARHPQRFRVQLKRVKTPEPSAGPPQAKRAALPDAPPPGLW